MRGYVLIFRSTAAKRLLTMLPLIVAACALIVPSSLAASNGRHRGTHGRRHNEMNRPRRMTRRPHRFGSALPASLQSHGQLLHLAPRLRFHTNVSSNWFGYDQGTLEQGNRLFSSISGDWTVPTASQHTRGQAESSSDWIGIGGGCLDSGCTLTDSTLIQTGTEQDVSSNGTASYSAWYELVPAPSLTISNMTVAPGDHMHAAISQVVPGLWTITLQDLTRSETFSTTLPYSSTEATAEWIEETPLVIDTNAGFAPLPNLTTVPFTSASTNGAPANLQASEETELVDSNGNVIGAPSAPKSSQSFDACAWASSCS